MTAINKPIAIFWYRRDLRVSDNTGLSHALNSGYPVLPLFIFDINIIHELPEDDARVSFIYNQLIGINKIFSRFQSSILIVKGDPELVWKKLIVSYNIVAVYCNHDYEPYALQRDKSICSLLSKSGIPLHTYKDQVIFEKNEILKKDGNPYTVYSHYAKKWLETFNNECTAECNSTSCLSALVRTPNKLPPELKTLGFKESNILIQPFNIQKSLLDRYQYNRDKPSLNGTSALGPHLRFGTISIRDVIRQLDQNHTVYLKELIWREFYMQILYHFPHVIDHPFKQQYDKIEKRNRDEEFERWKAGETGYPLVDAGIRQLNKTGYMHNRVRMVAASFLCKHLLIDWRWGEAYFAKKLLDYELASNNGNWQWAAGCGCDAVPYFRIFNPALQQEKFDPDRLYIKKWIPEFDTSGYPKPMVNHKEARERAIRSYGKAFRSET